MPKPHQNLIERKLATLFETKRVQTVGGHERPALTSRVVILVSGDTAFGNFGSGEIVIDYPSLKARHTDIRQILHGMLREFGPDRHHPDIRPAAYAAIAAHPWHRNEAELKEFAARLMAPSALRTYEAHDVEQLLDGCASSDRVDTAHEAKRQQLLLALTRNGFRMGKTAIALNISRKTLYNRMRKFGLR